MRFNTFDIPVISTSVMSIHSLFRSRGWNWPGIHERLGASTRIRVRVSIKHLTGSIRKEIRTESPCIKTFIFWKFMLFKSSLSCKSHGPINHGRWIVTDVLVGPSG